MGVLIVRLSSMQVVLRERKLYGTIIAPYLFIFYITVHRLESFNSIPGLVELRKN